MKPSSAASAAASVRDETHMTGASATDGHTRTHRPVW